MNDQQGQQPQWPPQQYPQHPQTLYPSNQEWNTSQPANIPPHPQFPESPSQSLPYGQPQWDQQPPQQNGQPQWLPQQQSYGQPQRSQQPPQQYGQPQQTQYGSTPIPNYVPPQQPQWLPQQPWSQQQFQPVPTKPPKNGFFRKKVGPVPLWVIILLVAITFISAVVGTSEGSNPNSTNTPQSGGALQPTPTPTLEPSPTPTPTPTDTPTPIPPGTGDHMSLGTNYSQGSNGFIITHPTDHFSSSSTFAFVVSLVQPFNTTRVNLVMVKVEGDGTESVAFSVATTISNPDFNQLANRLNTGLLMEGNPPGKYKFEVENDSTILAQATFSYTG